MSKYDSLIAKRECELKALTDEFNTIQRMTVGERLKISHKLWLIMNKNQMKQYKLNTEIRELMKLKKLESEEA